MKKTKALYVRIDEEVDTRLRKMADRFANVCYAMVVRAAIKQGLSILEKNPDRILDPAGEEYNRRYGRRSLYNPRRCMTGFFVDHTRHHDLL